MLDPTILGMHIGNAGILRHGDILHQTVTQVDALGGRTTDGLYNINQDSGIGFYDTRRDMQMLRMDEDRILALRIVDDAGRDIVIGWRINKIYHVVEAKTLYSIVRVISQTLRIDDY